MPTAFIYHPSYEKYYFGPTHPFNPWRGKLTLEKIKQLGVFDEEARIYKPRIAENELYLVHTPEYIEFVKQKCRQGTGYLDRGDTPVTRELYEGGVARVSGSVHAASLIMQGAVSHALNPGGGIHHASVNRAAGFCVFNDLAVTTRYVQKEYDVERIAIVDVDAHHGDGTQEIFYDESEVLTISLHAYGFGSYPGTGRVSELGSGEGKGYSVNVPLDPATDHETYLYAFDEIVVPLIEKYSPDIIINQFGADGHYMDPLIGLRLTTSTYEAISSRLHELAHRHCGGKYLMTGAGGYNAEITANCWAIGFVTTSEFSPKNRSYDALFDKEKVKKSERASRKAEETIGEIKRRIRSYS